MLCLHAFWNWFTTEDTSPYWNQPYNDALIAIASVAAVVWAGGLIAFQIKQYHITRPFALDCVQNAFMISIAGLFMQPLTLRYLLVLFFFRYVIDGAYYVYRYRNLDWVTEKERKRYPTFTDEIWQNVTTNSRHYSWLVIAQVVLYIPLIIWPFPRALAWTSTAYIFIGYQTLLYLFNNVPNSGRPG